MRTGSFFWPGANRETAVAVAEIFRRDSLISEVLLFGSVARNGFGRDIDLILIADKGCGWDFMAHAEQLFQDFGEREKEDASALQSPTYRRKQGMYQNKRLRLMAAEAALPNEFLPLYLEAKARAYPVELDIFVFPLEWREYLDVLQKALPHEDPNFMKNIAKDAVKIA